MSVQRPFPAEDLEFIGREAAAVWPELRGKRIFVTGATGFFGRWLLESLFWADRRHALGVRVVALSRDPDSFLRASAHLCLPGLTWRKGSVASLSVESFEGERFDGVIHLATEADMQAHQKDPAKANAVITEGTRRALDIAARTGAQRFLFTSSGASQGPQPADLERVSEDYQGSWPWNDPSPYARSGEAKRQAEILCIEDARRTEIVAVIARCFTFAGPGMPLDSKFAFGNFIEDALQGRTILIKGDGTPIRSYLYAADLAVWLWTLFLRGRSGQVYNVGSENSVSMIQLAETIANAVGTGTVQINSTPAVGKVPERYLPSTQRAQREFGLRETVGLQESIRRTATWNGALLKH